MASTPASPKVKLSSEAIAARKAALKRLADVADDARINAAIARRGAGIDDHPADEALAKGAEEEAADAAKQLATAAAAAGMDAPKPSTELRNARREQLTQWRRQREQHADLAANPDAYGGFMLDGKTPIDVDANLRMVAEYDNAIAVLEAELAG